MELALITKHITSSNVHYLFRSIEESIGPLFASTCASAYAPLRIPNTAKLIASLKTNTSYFHASVYVPLLIPNASSCVHNYSHELIAATASVRLVRIRFNASKQRRRPCFAYFARNKLQANMRIRMYSFIGLILPFIHASVYAFSHIPNTKWNLY